MNTITKVHDRKLPRYLCFIVSVRRYSNTLFAAMLTTGMLVACVGPNVGSGTAGTRAAANDAASRISVCKSTDTQIDSANQCLQDDAACYQLSNGKWCTGERGNTCPAGSTALPAGQSCPPGKRCFRIGESLECTIG